MNAAAVSLLGVGAIAVLSSESARSAAAKVGIVVEPYVTDAHRKAMERFARPVLSVGAATGTATSQALHRWNQIANGMLALRGFHVVGRKSLVLWTAGDAVALCEFFLDAAKAGIAQRGTYRVTNLSLGPDFMNGDIQAGVLAKLEDAERPGDIPLTDLGEAVLACVQFRNRMSSLPQSMTLVDPFQVEANATISELAGSMDGVGYLVSGKPPPDPTIAGGIAAAGHAVGSFAIGIAGDAVGGVVTRVVGSPLLWAAALALVAWKVAL